MRTIALLTCLLFLYACDASVSTKENVVLTDPGTDKGRDAAITAARDFIFLLDQGNYEGTWNITSPNIKTSLGRFRWETLLSGMRKAMGSPIKREFIAAAYTRSLPDAPDGDYFLIELDSQFSTINRVKEKVVVSRDGADWKIAGYHFEKYLGNIKDITK